MIHVGTAGFSYADWSGVFYPNGMKSSDYLVFYSQNFDCVELDFTYYRQPSPATMAAMVRKVPSQFRFLVKAHKTLTHEIPPVDELAREYDTFRRGIEPMVEAGELGCILFQFPWSFKKTPENLEYVLGLGRRVPYAKAVVEFRNSSWATGEVYRALKETNLGFCCVDEPDLRGLFPKIAVSTSDIAYVRFHGRNAEKWFNHKEAWERYDYLYSQEELLPWVEKIKTLDEKAGDTYVLFNNCHRGQAALNALQMQKLLME